MCKPRVELDIKYHVEGLAEDLERFSQAAEWLAEKFRLSSFVASVAIVDDTTIHRLNREHLQHDWPTDVISFVFDARDGHVEGEIIASADTAKRLHEAAGWRHQDEILLYVIHGMLHLAGLDDVDEQLRLIMRKYEQDCLLALDVPGAEEHLNRWNDVAY